MNGFTNAYEVATLKKLSRLIAACDAPDAICAVNPKDAERLEELQTQLGLRFDVTTETLCSIA